MVSIYVSCSVVICQLFLKINIQIVYRLVNCRLAAVGCILDGWVDHWCTQVSRVWWIPNRNSAVLLHNNNMRNNRILQHQGIGVLHDYVCWPSLLHRGSQVLLRSLLLHRGSSLLRHQSGRILHRKYYFTPKYYTAAVFRTTLSRNTTLMLQFTTLQPTLHLGTTPQPPSTTPKRPHISRLTLSQIDHFWPCNVRSFTHFRLLPCSSCDKFNSRVSPLEETEKKKKEYELISSSSIRLGFQHGNIPTCPTTKTGQPEQ